MIRKLAAALVTGMLATTLALALVTRDSDHEPAPRPGWGLVWHR